MGVRMKPGARRLPQGSVRKLRIRLRGLRRELTPECITEQPVSKPKSKPKPFKWVAVGHQVPRGYLNAKQVEQIHWAIAEDFKRQDDPIYPAGMRDSGLLSQL